MSGTGGGKIIDIHAHAFSFDTDKTGCFVSDKLSSSVSISVIRRFYNIKRGDSPERMDEKIDKVISKLSSSLKRVEHVVLLAFDGFYDESGKFDRARTDFYVSNDHVRDIALRDGKFLYGASVNPNRRDALLELERVIKDGAVLLKWLPNTHGIDPVDEKYTDFYRLLAKNNLPLLVHTGREYALNVISQSYGDYKKLLPALKEGVTVIASHCGGLAIESPQYDYDRLTGFLKDYDNFYVDTSAMFLLNKRLYLYKLAREHELHHKIVYGSDWPVPSNPIFPIRKLSFVDAVRSLSIRNPIERNYFITKKLNFSDEIFYTGYKLIKKDNSFESI